MSSSMQSADAGDILWRWDGFLPRSYLFSLEPIESKPANLQQVPVPSGHLFISPDYQCTVECVESWFLVLIGYAIDLGTPGRNESEIARSLVKCGVEHGIDAMLAQTDDLAGRFAVICHLPDGWHAFGDACATRTIFFAESRSAIASHSTLLGDLIGAAPRNDLFRHFWCALPGNASPVPGVRILPANFVFDVAGRTMRRFWPRSPRRERPVSETIDELEELLVRTAELTAARWKPVLSLTAGVDSRLSLSIYHGIPNLAAFTYQCSEEERVDVEVARRMCERLGIEHRRLPMVERSRAEKAYRVVESMADCSFNKNVAPIFLSAVRGIDEPVIQVRSSLAEVGRAFWRYHPGMPTRLDPANWPLVSLAKSTASLPLREEAAECMRTEMRRFFADVGYDAVDPQSPQILGYDVWDLIYMEHRMSTWHAQALFASDMAFDTAILFNSRRVLDLLMSAPLPDRRNATLLRRITARRCPQISDIPINPRPRRSPRQLAAAAYRQFKRRFGFIRALESRFSH